MKFASGLTIATADARNPVFLEKPGFFCWLDGAIAYRVKGISRLIRRVKMLITSLEFGAGNKRLLLANLSKTKHVKQLNG